MARKTVKDLNNDFEVLKESFEILKSDFERKFDDLKNDYESKIKSIQDQISTPETNDEPSMRETSNNIAFKCRECSFSSGKRSDLKLHILALHPQQYECRLCSNIFDSRLAFELHQKSHNEEKNFKCDVCADMIKGLDMRTLSAEVLADWGNFVSLWLPFTQICGRKLKDYGGVAYLMQYF